MPDFAHFSKTKAKKCVKRGTSLIILYLPIVVALQKAGLVETKEGGKKKILSLAFAVGIIVVAVFIPVILIMAGVL